MSDLFPPEVIRDIQLFTPTNLTFTEFGEPRWDSIPNDVKAAVFEQEFDQNYGDLGIANTGDIVVMIEPDNTPFPLSKLNFKPFPMYAARWNGQDYSLKGIRVPYASWASYIRYLFSPSYRLTNSDDPDLTSSVRSAMKNLYDLITEWLEQESGYISPSAAVEYSALNVLNYQKSPLVMMTLVSSSFSGQFGTGNEEFISATFRVGLRLPKQMTSIIKVLSKLAEYLRGKSNSFYVESKLGFKILDVRSDNFTKHEDYFLSGSLLVDMFVDQNQISS